MREIRTYGSEGGAAQTNASSLPLSRGEAADHGHACRPATGGRCREPKGTGWVAMSIDKGIRLDYQRVSSNGIFYLRAAYWNMRRQQAQQP